MKKAPCLKPLVLIVEDTRDIAILYRHMLSALGINTVASAETIAEAKANVAKIDFDIILSDNSLPDGKGLDFLNKMALRHPGTYRCLITTDLDLTAGDKLRHNFKAKPLKLSEMEGIIEAAKKHAEEHAAARQAARRSARKTH
ncbi:MAG: response regulator [Candidatus Paceibacterota bacterium]|jgi:DNA-binding NtrC family response regulator